MSWIEEADRAEHLVAGLGPGDDPAADPDGPAMRSGDPTLDLGQPTGAWLPRPSLSIRTGPGLHVAELVLHDRPQPGQLMQRLDQAGDAVSGGRQSQPFVSAFVPFELGHRTLQPGRARIAQAR
jgi:hypothetical protein